MKDLGPLSLGHRDMVIRYLTRYPPVISEHTFCNLFAWRHSRPIQLVESKDALLILWEQDSCLILLGPPIGPIAADDVRITVKSVSDKPLCILERVPETALSPLTLSGWRAKEDRDNADYVYRVSNLANLAGNRYHKKRNLIAQCLAQCDPAYEVITPDTSAEVLDMQRRWCADHGCGKDPGLCSEFQAIKETLENFEPLRIMGGALRIDGQIEAYTLGEMLNKDTAAIHFEKAMSGFKGLYQLMNQRFCQEALPGFEYVNREQDLGFEGLRKSKESYHPDHMVKKYKIFVSEESRLIPRRDIERCNEL